MTFETSVLVGSYLGDEVEPVFRDFARSPPQRATNSHEVVRRSRRRGVSVSSCGTIACWLAAAGMAITYTIHANPRRTVKMAFQPWEYRADAGFTEGTDLTGYTVVAVDGDLGHVEEVYDSTPAYLEVETGSWLFGREVMLPAGLVERIDTTEKKVYVDRTKDQIKDAPRYDQAFTDHVDHWERLGSYYAGTYMPPGGQV
jgi:hypothetical protein